MTGAVWKEGPMDQVVDQAGELMAEDEVTPPDLDESQDIEDELYCSTREAGITALGFGPVLDA